MSQYELLTIGNPKTAKGKMDPNYLLALTHAGLKAVLVMFILGLAIRVIQPL